MGFRVGHCHLQLPGLAVGMNIIYVKTEERVKELTPVFQKLVSVIHWINHYPVDKCQENQLLYPLDSGLLGGQCYPPFDQRGPDGIFMKGKVCIFRRIGFKFFLILINYL